MKQAETEKRNEQVLIADPVHEILTEGLVQKGFSVLYLPDAERSDILKHLPGATILVVRTKTNIDEDLLSHAPQLRIIARAGAGLDNIDLEAANARGIICVNAGEANADAVGEHALGMLLMVTHHLSRAHQEVQQGVWKREANRGTELKGKTIALIGYGNTGKAFARKLSGMEMKLMVYDKYLQGYGSETVMESNWEEIADNADILSFHVPLTSETRNYFNEDLLNRFRKPLLLLNLSRGEVVDAAAVVNGLKTSKIKGAGLDVLENEKLSSLTPEQQQRFQFLVNHPAVVLTPHIGGWTHESYKKISEVLLGKLLTLSDQI